MKGRPQPPTWTARLVVLSTTTRPDICKPAVIVRDGSTTRTETSGAGDLVCGLTAGCAVVQPAHPATTASNVSRATLNLMSISLPFLRRRRHTSSSGARQIMDRAAESRRQEIRRVPAGECPQSRLGCNIDRYDANAAVGRGRS